MVEHSVSKIITASDPLTKAQHPTVVAFYRRFKASLPDGDIPSGFIVEALKVMLADVMRVQFADRDKAHKEVDRHVADIKALIALHYNSQGKRVEGNFATNQRLEMPHADFRKRH